jgi:annexin A7/11
MLHEYERISGRSFEKAIQGEFSGDVEAGFLALVKSARNRAAYFAERIHESVAGMGTKDDDLIFLVVTRAEIDMENIKQEYNKMYHKSVSQAISGDTSGDYKKVLLALVGM